MKLHAPASDGSGCVRVSPACGRKRHIHQDVAVTVAVFLSTPERDRCRSCDRLIADQQRRAACVAASADPRLARMLRLSDSPLARFL